MTQRNMSSKRYGAHVQGKRVIDDGFESAECALEREQAAADALTPDWDMASRITTARGALERGVPAVIVRKAYGEKIFAAASAHSVDPDIPRVATYDMHATRLQRGPNRASADGSCNRS